MPHAVPLFASMKSKLPKPEKKLVQAQAKIERRDSSFSDASTSPTSDVDHNRDVDIDHTDKLSFLLNDNDEDHNSSDPTSSSDSSDHEDLLPSSPDPTTSYSFDKSTIADLVATYGSSSATAWLEFDRYRIWQGASSPPSSSASASPITMSYIPESSFPPVIGYMRTSRHVFPWGDPVVSSPAALEPTARAFVNWAKGQSLKVVWCCVGHEMEEVLANLGWATLECIHEEVMHPEHVLEVTGLGVDEENEGKKERKKRERKERKERKEKGDEKAKAEGKSMERDSSAERVDKEKLKDLKKNLRRAERAGVQAEEVTGSWTPLEREEVEQGMVDWRRNKGLKGVQLASTTGLPWIDEPHRRYWIARHENQIVGILILTPIHPPHDSHHPNLGITPPVSPTSPTFPTSITSGSPTTAPIKSTTPLIKSYLIKNAVSFPSAPRGTSEHLIFTALARLAEEERALGIPITVTFGITASDTLKIGHNLGGGADSNSSHSSPSSPTSPATANGHGQGKAGWKITTLSAIYNKVAKGAGLLKRGDFRAKFDTEKEGMYVAYEVGPKGEGIGLDGVRALLKVLRK